MRTHSGLDAPRAAEEIMGFPWQRAVFLFQAEFPADADTEEKSGADTARIGGGTAGKPRARKNGKNRLKARRILKGHSGAQRKIPGQEILIQTEEIRDGKAFHKNYTEAEFARALTETILPACTDATLFSQEGNLTLKKNRRGEIALLAPRRAVQTAESSPRGTPPSCEAHDKKKRSLLPEDTPLPFLVELGVMTEQGKPIAPMQGKFRQINKFLELVADTLPAIEAIVREKGKLRVVDFGYGKSYLTFAVYYFLRVQKKLPVEITGLDLKQDVMERCNALAERCGYGDLRFFVGDIASFKADERFDMMLTLHACDTATDDALAKAVKSGTKIILSVPCCQHEVNAQLAQNLKDGETPEAMQPVFQYGILRERAAAIFTDAMRAALLRANGYAVQVLEFIDMQHTAKNIMLRAVKLSRPQTGADTDDGTAKAAEDAYRALRDFLRVRPALENLLQDGEA